MSTTAEKTATRSEILAACKGDKSLAFVLIWCNGAERDEADLQSALSGVNCERDDLSETDEALAEAAYVTICSLVSDGLLTRRARGVRFYVEAAGALRGRITL